jgi:hypothetical protein
MKETKFGEVQTEVRARVSENTGFYSFFGDNWGTPSKNPNLILRLISLGVK